MLEREMSSGQRSRVCSSGPENASVQDRAGGGKSLRQQDQRWQLQLPGGPVPPEKVHQLPSHPELSALNTDSGRVLGLLLDGHRVCSWQNISGGHHLASCFSARYWHFSPTDFICQGLCISYFIIAICSIPLSPVMACYISLNVCICFKLTWAQVLLRFIC